MISGMVIRRLLLQALMWPILIIKIDPALGFPQELPKCAIGTTFGNGKLEHAHKPLGVAIVGRGSCATHRAHEAFRQERCSRLLRSILAALIGIKDGARN